MFKPDNTELKLASGTHWSFLYFRILKWRSQRKTGAFYFFKEKADVCMKAK